MATDELPNLPERQVIEPIVQCGVLYIGTAVPSPGRRGLDSVQEPLSHRYPVDGTNTVQGIDSILSIYDNGIQLTFLRQPYVVIFFPLSSLIYCASLRFSIVENDQTSNIDWRFNTLDSSEPSSSKHPPLFCAVVQRTQILLADECHCFLTKNATDALTLVRIISEVYAKLPMNIKPIRSPIFYQLDRYGRKITETSGVIYLSPATPDESQIDPSNNSISRQVLLDPELNGFFYRSDITPIEQWQLWDDDDVKGVRPRPPASPFGQNQGLYHDDLTDEIQHYLRQMDIEEPSSSSSNSASSNEYRHCHRRHHSRSRTQHPPDIFNKSFCQPRTGSFDPMSIPVANNSPVCKPPIIIEKVLPNPMLIPRSKHPFEQSSSIDHIDPYHANEREERLERESNRIHSMEIQSHETRRSSRRKRSKHVPMVDLRSMENLLFKESEHRNRTIYPSVSHDNDNDDRVEIVEGYFEDSRGRKMKLNGSDAQTMLEHFETSPRQHRHRTPSTITSGPDINYVERSSLPPSSQLPSIQSPPSPPPPPISNPEPPKQQETAQTQSDLVDTPDFISPFRYMQSSVNPLLLREYRHLFFNTVQ